MAKRVHTPKAVSPEIARENALSVARAHVINARKDVADAHALIKRITEKGPIPADAVGGEVTLEKAQAELAWKLADLERAEAGLAELGG